MVGRLPFLRNKNLSGSFIFLIGPLLRGLRMHKAKASGESFLAQTLGKSGFSHLPTLVFGRCRHRVRGADPFPCLPSQASIKPAPIKLGNRMNELPVDNGNSQTLGMASRGVWQYFQLSARWCRAKHIDERQCRLRHRQPINKRTKTKPSPRNPLRNKDAEWAPPRTFWKIEFLGPSSYCPTSVRAKLRFFCAST